MRRFSFAAAILLSLCLSSSLFGQVATFDETGFGQFGGGVLAPDPGPGGLASTLTYPDPFPVVVGDLIMLEPPGFPSFPQNSDLIRWNGNNSLIFYSDITDGVNSLADVGNPNVLYANNLSRNQTGVEGGFQDLFYTPVGGQPGFDPTNPTLTYHFISDVPEPATAGVAAIAGFLMALRRKSRA